MTDIETRLALKKRLPRTWPAFFERHGNFTETQIAALPPLLSGQNILLVAPTASGKTEAVTAPLVERHCLPGSQGLRLLYITPTRALASDLYQRITIAFEHLHLVLAIKTRDFNTFRKERPAAMLISTPESVDSLLTSQAQVFATLQAVIIDELHLFDGAPRGDHLRVLMKRLQVIHRYAVQQDVIDPSNLQYAALSATLSNPSEIAGRYFPAAHVVYGGGGRSLQAELLPLTSQSDLSNYLFSFRKKGWRKAVVFCNSRSEAEYYASVIHPNSPFGSAVYVHYSNIDARQRHEIEERFASDEAAICFATSTLELGIDIGSIDVVILIGPPSDVRSFMQRIGRGNRRRRLIQVACFYRDPLEDMLFKVFINQTDQNDLASNPPAPFIPSVAVQQIFSIMKQSPHQAIRMSLLNPLFEGMLTPDEMLMIVGHLQDQGYLTHVKPGEWRAGTKLNKLVDEQNSAYAALSLYSNIRTEPRQMEVRDQHTGRRVARVSAASVQHDVITLQGHSQRVQWSDGETLWVASQADQQGQRLPYLSTRQYLNYETAQRIPLLFNITSDEALLVQAPDGGWWLFHWLGDLYGLLLLGLLGYNLHAKVTNQPGLYVSLPEAITTVPTWSVKEIHQQLTEDFRRFEGLVNIGAYYRHVPNFLREKAVINQINPDRFYKALTRMRLVSPSEEIAIQLRALVD
jgi:ATP-dependent helicase Lhr and Lhr-like helicase